MRRGLGPRASGLGKNPEVRCLFLIAALAACGPQPQPQPQPQPDPAMAEVISALRTQRDHMCACGDEACVEKVEAEQFEWGFAHKELVDHTKPTRAQQKEATALIEAAEHCAHSIRD